MFDKLIRPLLLGQGFVKFNMSIRKVITGRHFSTITELQKKGSKAWNDAASVMIVAPMNNSEPHHLGYLLVERSRTGKIMPGHWVFPGGNFDRMDGDPQWIELFKDILNIDLLQEKYFKEGAHVPQIYSPDEGTQIPKQVSLRITGVRETFEEAGILLCRPRKIDPDRDLHNGMLCYEFDQLKDKKDLQAWQKKVRKNSAAFLEMCSQFDCAPDIRSFHDWSNWLTPTVFKPKSRFDTLFYMTILPKMPKVVVDGNEAGNAQWVSPPTVLAEHGKGQIRLMPPQIYEFQRLKSVKTITELRERLSIRKELGIERYLPVIRNASDATIFVLPGDDLYPDPPDYIGSDTSAEVIPKTAKELKESCSNFHRGIAKSDGIVTQYEINVTRYGHMY